MLLYIFKLDSLLNRQLVYIQERQSLSWRVYLSLCTKSNRESVSHKKT